jgi:hypothetical protein
VAHKQEVRARFLQLAADGGATRPDELAGALVLLMDGAYMTSRMFGAAAGNPAIHLSAAVRHIIDAALPE